MMGAGIAISLRDQCLVSETLAHASGWPSPTKGKGASTAKRRRFALTGAGD